jgi:hypothetical protein
MEDFLSIKCQHGTKVERQFYTGMTVEVRAGKKTASSLFLLKDFTRSKNKLAPAFQKIRAPKKSIAVFGYCAPFFSSLIFIAEFCLPFDIEEAFCLLFKD